MFEDFLGQRFGRLTVIAKITRDKWLFRCDCGKEKVINCYNVRRGKSQSCGCLHRERNSAAHWRHGLSKHPLMSVWQDMKDRCQKPNDKRYLHYGGRGIKVCERWLAFENFYADMQPTYQRGLSLDRIDVNGNYEPSNCKWATQTEQIANRRNSRLIDTPWGRITIGAAAKKMGLSYVPMMYRVEKWPPERWFDKPRR